MGCYLLFFLWSYAVFQGLALGGEWGGAALMVKETKGGAKSLLGSVVQVASPLGFLLANLVFVIVDVLTTDEEFLLWGWRIPFLASAILVLFGLYIRSSLKESPEFEEMQSLKFHSIISHLRKR